MPDAFDFTTLWNHIATVLPLACLQSSFMVRALVGLALLAPLAAAMGVQVVNFRMAFYSDAISHSAFAGVALGIILGIDPHGSMAILGLLVGLAIVAMQRRSALSSDTVIGVFFSAVVAFGLAVVSRDRSIARNVQQFLYGDILTIGDGDIVLLMALGTAILVFQAWGYNRMLAIGLNPLLAEAHRVRVAAYQYTFAALLALVVIQAVWAVGVLLVTALLVVPAAAARNFARTAGGMFGWAVLIGTSSAIFGLIISAQEWARTATGATIILVAFSWFLASAGVCALRGARAR